MKIKKITSQNRRDFSAVLICEHCEHKQKLNSGYDDDFYHRNIIPAIKCEACEKAAPSNYRPMGTKYAAGQQV